MRRQKPSIDSGTSSETRRTSKSSKSSKSTESGSSSRSAKSTKSDRASRYDIPVADACLYDVSNHHVRWSHPPRHPFFTYDEVEVRGPEFRLFRVEITSYGEAIGWLECFDLRDAPPYKALSYTWGNETVYHRILVNGASFPIAQNLYQFLELHAARHQNEWIWIDQICISQLATEEKNEQVQLMSGIFRRAAEVLIWIRPSQDLECRIDDQRRHWEGGNGPWECDRLMDLLTNNYWSRVWILQEVLLGRSRTIWYGDYVLAWQHLYRLADANILHFPPGIPTQLQWLLRTVETVSLSRLEPIDLAEAIENCHNSESKDPRDKVYGLQGLIHADQRVEVDYYKPVVEVYIDAAVIYPTCSNEVSGLLSLARSMGIRRRRSSNGDTLIAILYRTVEWYEEWGNSSRSKQALRSMLRKNLVGPEIPGTPPMPPLPPEYP
jgi:hypothetical protein